MKRLLFLTLVTAVVLAGAATAAFLYLDLPVSDSDERVAFTIRNGEPFGSIAMRLHAEGVIRSALFMRLLGRLHATESAFQSGSYLLPRNRTARWIHDRLISGGQVLVRVTIPEGWTISRIARHMEERGITSAADFIAAAGDHEAVRRAGLPGTSFEGFLFPETYHFQAGFPAARVVQHMVDTFFARLQEAVPGIEQRTLQEIFRTVTLASIVEREYRDPQEAPLMASVFYNRLEVNMPLGSCATVEYVITELLGRPHPGFLTYADIAIESEYNTYIHSGLPPGPISNPGLTALKAAFFPAQTNYWFFVLRDPAAGRHFFSRTLAEHNRARYLYLKSQD